MTCETDDERRAAIATLLFETILPRFARPEHLDDATAESGIADMVEDLTEVWPVVTASESAAVGRRFAKQVR